MSPALRPYQVAAVERTRGRTRQCRKVLLVAPTGAGKTVIAAHIITRAHAKGRRVIFFAHRRELIHQTVRKLIDAGIPAEAIGVLMADDPLTNPAAPIQVASIDTWRHRESPPADLVIIDEAHRSLAQTYLDAIAHYSEAGAIILGMTATPYRADGGGLGDVYEALEVVASPAELIAEGFLTAPRVFSAPRKARPDLSGVRTRMGDYVESDLAEAMNQRRLVGGIVEHWQRLAEGRRTVVFATGIAHSQAIADAFIEAGIAAEHLDGMTPTRDRDAILRRLDTGETLIVSNCGVLCEGWDQPSVKCAVLARPTKSTGLYLQQAGRILRPWEGIGALILDHAGNALVHGLPQDDREFELNVTKKRKTGGEAPTKECPECDAVVPLGVSVCPECGYEFPGRKPAPDVVAADLEEIDAVPIGVMKAVWGELVEAWEAANERRASRGEKPMKPGWVWHKFHGRFGRKPPPGCKLPPEIATPDEKAEALRELHETRRSRGYKPGWVVHRFAERFGHMPGATP
jgi:DNA repair protein RadD